MPSRSPTKHSITASRRPSSAATSSAGRLGAPAIKLRHHQQVAAGTDRQKFGRALENRQDQDVDIRHSARTPELGVRSL